jgi:hypothetical protein
LKEGLLDTAVVTELLTNAHAPWICSIDRAFATDDEEVPERFATYVLII